RQRLGRLRDLERRAADPRRQVRVPSADGLDVWMTLRSKRATGGGRPPAAAVAVAVLGILVFFVLPLAGLIQRLPWGQFVHDLTDPSVRPALRLSLVCSLSATAISIVVGVPIAWVLARTEFPGKPLVRALATLPLVLPPVVGGIALLAALGRRGVF